MQSCLFFDDIDLIEINVELESEHITFFMPLSSIQGSNYRHQLYCIAKWSVVLFFIEIPTSGTKTPKPVFPVSKLLEPSVYTVVYSLQS